MIVCEPFSPPILSSVGVCGGVSIGDTVPARGSCLMLASVNSEEKSNGKKRQKIQTKTINKTVLLCAALCRPSYHLLLVNPTPRAVQITNRIVYHRGCVREVIYD